MTGEFSRAAHGLQRAHAARLANKAKDHVDGKKPVSFRATLFHFLGEVEVVFGLWLIPLLLAMFWMKPSGASAVSDYIDTRNFTEPMFVVVIMVADSWNWNLPYMFTHFGWRAIIGIVFASTVYYFVFRREFAAIEIEKARLAEAAEEQPQPEPVPLWIVGVHIGFIAWTVITLHHPALFIGGFLFFLGFTLATQHHQFDVRLRTPLLVGFFLAGLIIHGGLQGWWISPVLGSLKEVPLFITATILTAFNDNATVTFLASQAPSFAVKELSSAGLWVSKTGSSLLLSQNLEYAVVAGAVTGGGLTLIANAPNPAGHSLLKKHFPGGVAPFKLLLAALFPTIVMAVMFMALRP